MGRQNRQLIENMEKFVWNDNQSNSSNSHPLSETPGGSFVYITFKDDGPVQICTDIKYPEAYIKKIKESDTKNLIADFKIIKHK